MQIGIGREDLWIFREFARFAGRTGIHGVPWLGTKERGGDTDPSHASPRRLLANDCDQRLADKRAFMQTDFIASPLHRLVLGPLNDRRRSVVLLTLP